MKKTLIAICRKEIDIPNNLSKGSLRKEICHICKKKVCKQYHECSGQTRHTKKINKGK